MDLTVKQYCKLPGGDGSSRSLLLLKTPYSSGSQTEAL